MHVKIHKYLLRWLFLGRFAWLLIATISSHHIHATERIPRIQLELTGSIIDENSIGIPFANVLLLKAADSTFVKGSITDQSGNYSISDVKPGQYVISSHMLGFINNYSSVFRVVDQDVSLPPLQLEESVEKLEEVTIQAEMPLFEQTIDRLIIHVEKSPVAAGGTVLEVLERSPGVVVDRMNNSISMSGKSGVNVMINGKMNRMSADALYAFLESVPSQNVQKVELITTPPANFEAEGNAGYINIILKRDDSLGMNGSFSLSAGHGRREQLQAGGGFNYRAKKLNLFSTYTFNRARAKILGTAGSDIVNSQYAFKSNSSSRRKGGFDMSSARIGADYYINSKTIVGVLGDIYFRDWYGNTETNSFYDVDPGVDSLVFSKRENRNPRLFSTFNINVSHRISEKHTLDLDIDHLVFTNDQDQFYGNEFIPQNDDLSSIEQIRITKINPTRLWVGKVDYTFKGEKSRFETGLKATINNFKNDVWTERLMDSQFVNDPFFTFYNLVREDIFGAYGSFSADFSEFSLKAGLRYEHTITDIEERGEEQIVYRNYGNLFPSIFLSRKMSDKISANLSYTARITRPGFIDLSPAPKFFEPRTFQTGNAALLPVLTHTIRTGLTWNRLIASVEYNRIDDQITRQPFNDGNTNQVFIIPINLGKSELVVINLSFPVIVNDWWEMNNNISGFYQDVGSPPDFGVAQRLVVRYANMNTSQQFKLGNRMTAEIGGFYYSGYGMGFTTFEPFGQISIGIRRDFQKNGGSLSINLQDVFKTINYHALTVASEGNLVVSRSTNMDSRILRLTYSKNFGNNKIKSRSKRKVGSADDQKRL